MKKYWVFLFLFAFAAVSTPLALPAQSTGGEQISWDDEDDEEEVEEGEDLSTFTEADVWVKEEKMVLAPEMDLEYERKDTFMIKVRHLRPASFVFVSLQKAGMKLEKKRYRTNNKGELDLEVRTGKRKVKGSATMSYTTGAGEKKSIDVKIAVK